ncbi:MAG: hypothetical protein LBG84_06520, partial [Treponema sp.]|nr:hypothetical protein [Treponema sp.]
MMKQHRLWKKDAAEGGVINALGGVFVKQKLQRGQTAWRLFVRAVLPAALALAVSLAACGSTPKTAGLTQEQAAILDEWERALRNHPAYWVQ